MWLLPSHGVPVTLSSLDLNLKCHLLRIQAEILAYELQREIQLRSMGLASSPEGWITYLQCERQRILDELHRYERARNEHPVCSLEGIPVACSSSHSAARLTSLPRMDDETYRGPFNSILGPHSTGTQNIGQYACICNSTTCNPNCRQGRADLPVVREHKRTPPLTLSLSFVLDDIS